MNDERPNTSNVPRTPKDERDRDDAVIAADDTGMLAGERLISNLDTEPERDADDAGDV